MLDGTPLLDIKPYVPQLDDRAEARIGWYEGRLETSPLPAGRAFSLAPSARPRHRMACDGKMPWACSSRAS